MVRFYTLLKKINFLVSLLAVSLALYILALPFFPEVIYKVNKLRYRNFDTIAAAKYRENNRNYLVIPSIMIDSEIYDGVEKLALKNGVWHRPLSGTPQSQGNMVLVAHRFLYTNGPKTFYHLNKMRVGDEIEVIWQGRIFEYEVIEVFEVKKDELWIEGSTDGPMITLYTCTPLWTAEKRLVVRAKLISQT